ncbi:MAG: hypothetical protein PHC88_16530 [Terrimicrobiaceae bacterium]|nr:hypothetical protein [Terrimicrobiaceae bacterium]
MKPLFRLFAGIAIVACACSPAVGAPNAYAALPGAYSGTFTAETASSATGPVTVTIVAPAKKKRRLAIEIAGTISPLNTVAGTGNATPVRARIYFRRSRVMADSFLLGIGAKRAPARVSRLRGIGAAFRFTLDSAAGEGRMRCSLKLAKGILTISGDGFFQPTGSARQPVRIVIAATKS